MSQSIDAIYMVEASPKLRMAQKNLLCGEDAPMTESKVGYHSICKSTSLPIVWTETIKSIPLSKSLPSRESLSLYIYIGSAPANALSRPRGGALHRSSRVL